MIKHIVMYKIKEEYLNSIESTKQLLETLPENVDVIRELHVGIDCLKSERSYDLVLEIIFDNLSDMEIYKQCDYHKNVIQKHMHEIREKSVSVDYKF